MSQCRQCLKHCVASMALQAYTRPFQVMFIDKMIKMLRNIAHLELPEVVQMLLLSFLWIAHEPVTFVLKVTRVLLTLGLSETCFDTLQFWARSGNLIRGLPQLDSTLKDSRKTYEHIIFDCLWNMHIRTSQSANFSHPICHFQPTCSPCSQCSCSAMTPGT